MPSIGTKPRRVAALGALIVLTVVRGAVAGVVILAPTKDATLIEDASGAVANGLGDGIFAGNNSAENTLRAALAFDVAGNVPPESTIVSVELQLRVSSAPNATPRVFTLHRLTSGWDEGTSVANGGRGVPAESGDVTWLHTSYPDQFWGNAGGDFEAAASASATVGEAGMHRWTDAGLVADVRAWQQAPATNFGWILRGEEIGASTTRAFHSRQSECTECRPLLIIHFARATTSVSGETWSGVKAKWR